MKTIKEIKIENENNNLNFKFGNIELKNISFYYKKNKYVLENINFKIEKKSRILIQGKSGCGKSTFLDILCGLLPPENGEIYINNIKANDLDKKKLLSKVSYVSQMPFLLDNDLVANIALGMDKIMI